MEMHKLLLRQINRYDLDVNSLPTDQEQWKNFIERINNSYIEADQERYLLERSMDISSRELLDLNEKLENAQQIARLGYWVYEKDNDLISWSKELYSLFKLERGKEVPKFKEIMMMIHEEDRQTVDQAIKNAFTSGRDYEYEIRMKNFEDEYRWFYIIGRLSPDRESIAGIAMDITERKQAEEEVSKLHQQLMQSARRAGMADIATSILHNVGNILNSSNVSLGLMQENINRPHFEKLFTIIDMLKEHLPQLQNYICADPKGKLIPEYLIALAEPLTKNLQTIEEEINNLTRQLQHIKDIVNMQQSISGVSGIVEKVFLPELVDSALQMSSKENFNEIQISKAFEDIPFVFTDKTKLLQILVNLIQNASESTRALPEDSLKIITLFIKVIDSKGKVILGVEDNGIGVAENDLTKIFSFGFTTKKGGHGFGLHSSALAAIELGGKLEVESEGLGKGARFILTLPLNSQERSEVNDRSE
jgi:PAS domain S-box-containing protein